MENKDKAYFRKHVFCCQNVREPGHSRGCCSDKGSVELRDYMKDQCKKQGLADVRINVAGCLDRCELGPVMVIYPEGVWYNYKTKEDVDKIIEAHLKNDSVVDELYLAQIEKDYERRFIENNHCGIGGKSYRPRPFGSAAFMINITSSADRADYSAVADAAMARVKEQVPGNPIRFMAVSPRGGIFLVIPGTNREDLDAALRVLQALTRDQTFASAMMAEDLYELAMRGICAPKP